MKYFFSLLFLFGCLTTFSQNTIDGNWKGTRETPNGTFEVNYTFKVEGNELKGTWKTQFGETKIENGKVDGKTFSYSITFNDMTIKSTGEVVNENELLVKNERGEMKLTRVNSKCYFTSSWKLLRTRSDIFRLFKGRQTTIQRLPLTINAVAENFAGRRVFAGSTLISAFGFGVAGNDLMQIRSADDDNG